MENILLALFFTVIAGIFNGSWGFPQKYMIKWKQEAVWLPFCTFTFLIFPWITLYLLSPTSFLVFKDIPSHIILTAAVGGILFGLGQVVFVISFGLIGLGISFVINISIATAGSAIVPFFWHKDLVNTPYFYTQLLGILLFVIAVILGAMAGAERDKAKQASEIQKEKSIHLLVLGISFCIIAGIGSAIEGLTYILVNPTISNIAINKYSIENLSANLMAWPIIFSFTWVSFFTCLLFKGIKLKSFKGYSIRGTGKYWVIIILMGLVYWLGLVFFSKASSVIGGELAPTIAWPLFMVFIILTSNFWGWVIGEWKNAGTKATIYISTSICLFIIAISVFTLSTVFKP
jgi:L-rhamnose-H+ transport protein